MRKAPMAAGQALVALDMYLGPTPEIVVLGNPGGDETSTALADLRRRYVPNQALACRPTAALEGGSENVDPIFQGKVAAGDPPTVYICQKFACQAPVHGAEEVMNTWASLELEAQTAEQF
jgi:uncharacterized protein YyaL (SSP411 family)